FGADIETKLFAFFVRQVHRRGHLLPARLHHGKDDPVDIRFGNRGRKQNVVPFEYASDRRKVSGRYQVWGPLEYLIDQITAELDDEFVKRSGVRIFVCRSVRHRPSFIETMRSFEHVREKFFPLLPVHVLRPPPSTGAPTSSRRYPYTSRAKCSSAP